mgnify:CR=1 FL=1
MNSTKKIKPTLKFSYKYVLLVLIGILVGISSCKDCCEDPANPDCDNYDPCYGLSETNADFKMEVAIFGRGANPEWFELDQLFDGGRTVRFTPKHDLDSVVWLIGTERLTDNVIVRSNFTRDRTITVTLIGKKKPSTHCFPLDDGIDTVSLSFYVHPDPKWIGEYPQDTIQAGKSPILGKYIGYRTSDPSNEIEIELKHYWKKNGGIYQSFSHIVGLPYSDVGSKPWIGRAPSILFYDYNAFVMDDDSRYSSTWDLSGNGFLDTESDEIKINFTYFDSSTYDPNDFNARVYKNDKFIGKKLD